MAKQKLAPKKPADSPKKPNRAIAKRSEAEIIAGLPALRKRADALIAKWQDPKIESAESFESAGVGVKDFVSLRKDLKATIYPVVAEAKKRYDTARKAYNTVDDILDDAENALRQGLIAYEVKHRKAQEIRVEKALASGKDEKAASIAAKAYTPDVEGLSFRDVWHGEVVDFKAYLTAVLDGRLPPEAVEASASWLNAKARAEHESFAVPGAKAVKETITGVRT